MRGLLLSAVGATVAVTILLAITQPVSVAAGFVSGVALGGASLGTLVLFGRGFVTNITKSRHSALMALQLAKWPVFAAVIYLLVTYYRVNPVALAVGFGAAMLTGLCAGVRRREA